MSFANAHRGRLEALRKIRHVLQGEAATIDLLGWDAETGGYAAEPLVTIATCWAKDRVGLGMGVYIEEFQVGEGDDLLTSEQGLQAVAVQHGSQIFKVQKRIAPEGINRYWRFQLQPIETA